VSVNPRKVTPPEINETTVFIKKIWNSEWSTIQPILTKQKNSHLKQLNTKKTLTYAIGSPGPGLGQAQK